MKFLSQLLLVVEVGSISELLQPLNNIFLVSLGAVLGSWMRICLINYFGLIFAVKSWGTFMVNMIAVFGFSLLMSTKFFLNLNPLDGVYLFLFVGFLGSLSTFSTFVVELLESLMHKCIKEFAYLAVASIVGGIFFAALGISLLES